MTSRMLANHVDDRHLRPTGVVQVRQTVGETGTEMKESASWLFCHARIAVRGTRHHAFEKTKHAAHFRDSVQCCHDVDFRSAGVREASINPSGNQRAN